jgi:hypothetical protein
MGEGGVLRKYIMDNDIETNIIEFPGETLLDIDPSKMLEECSKEELETALVVACRPDGSLFFASSTGDLYQMLWFLEVAKQEVLEMGTE